MWNTWLILLGIEREIAAHEVAVCCHLHHTHLGKHSEQGAVIVRYDLE